MSKIPIKTSEYSDLSPLQLKCLHYTTEYNSPLGKTTMESDGIALTGLWFNEQKYFADSLAKNSEAKNLPIFEETKAWLDRYFKGENPGKIPAVHLAGTKFRLKVWKILSKISYGKTISYGHIANKLANEMDIQKMSAQAVGGAVKHNPIAIIIPCHRVVGANGNMTGYAAGISRKVKLLEMEKKTTNS